MGSQLGANGSQQAYGVLQIGSDGRVGRASSKPTGFPNGPRLEVDWEARRAGISAGH
jgi:hypothetical protein